MTKFRAIILALIILFLFSITSIVFFYTDLLWFSSLGFRSIFTKIILAKLITGLAFGVFSWIFLFANILLARRLAPKLYYLTPNLSLQSLIQQVKPYLDRFFTPILIVGSLVLSFLIGLGMSNQWDAWLRLFNQELSPVKDPLFNHSISFYFFTLPALESLQNYFFFIIFITILVAITIHVLDGSIVPGLGRQTFAPHVKAHLSWLAGLLMLDLAFMWYLRIYNLLYAPTGNIVYGASYTDVKAVMPALKILVAVGIIAALILVINIALKGWRLPILALSLTGAVWLLALNIYPALIQAYKVTPNEIAREKPYIKLNISGTRAAYNLNKIKAKPFPALTNLDLNMIAANKATLDNIRLWDWRPLKRTYSQIQEIRLYYLFKDVDLDRYRIDNKSRQVALSGRELSINKLPSTAKTWINEHLVFTHGYGAVMSPVNKVTPDGLPNLLIKNIPPISSSNIKLKRPEIYYGEETGNYVITKTNTDEFNYPKGEKNQYTTYKGSGGIRLKSTLTKALFSYRFSSLKMFLSDSITNKSRILFNRDIVERAKTIAPFLRYDTDPYLVISKGKLYWILDAYTVSDRYPYSTPFSGRTNYLRNSVKIVIDAYNGSINYYLIDPNDIIAATYSRMFPQLFTEFNKMPPDLKAHLRYPENLFSIQAEMYKTFHMEDPQVFYNKEDMWAIPDEITNNGREAMKPYYVIMKIPGEQEEEFLLMLPFTPTGKSNMIAWLAARNDAPNYGQLRVFEFPKDRLVYGPSQIEARIDQDPKISQQLSLWNQRGSRVIRGNLLVIPIEQSILYVEPIYLQSEQSDLPELKRVIVGYNNKIIMEPTLAAALAKIFTGAPPPPSGKQPADGEKQPTQKNLIDQADEHFNKAGQAAQSGDWKTYGEELKKLGEALNKLKEAQKK